MSVSRKLVNNVIFSVFLAIIVCECSTESEMYKVLNMGGLFPIHSQKKNQTSLCGSFRIGGFEELNAMLFAIDKVNEDENLLPGIKLKVKIDDTCSSIEVATKKSLDYTIINYQSIYECFGNSSQDKPILAILGARSSDISRAVTNLVGLFHIPVISYGATSSSLTGVKYFTRTKAPDTFSTQTLIDILEQFSWNYVILLYSDNEYGLFAAESFRERLRKEKKNMCIAVDEHISEDITENLQTWQKIHKEKHRTKVVVVFAIYDDYSSFLQAGKERYNLEEYIWLSEDIWNGHTAKLTDMLRHAISVIPNQIFIKEFANFFHHAREKMKSLKQHSTFDESWFEEYKSYAESETRSSVNSCIKWGSSDVSHVMDAVYTIAWALHSVLNCNSTTKTCNKSETKNFFKR
jgi:ABC-type branched-subunit amino acid transport system substrate-binding protein